MAAGYSDVLGSGQLHLGPADASSGMDDDGILYKSSAGPPVSSNVRLEELLKHRSGPLTALTG